MKALILAAGLGTRLKPYTDILPKPLFPVNGMTALERTIHHLSDVGCTGIIVNTHHLHLQIEEFIRNRTFPVPVITRHEPVILDTGGAIRNVADFLGNDPFFVVNSDIVTDLDFSKVMAFHEGHDHPVTLVLHDYPEFNNVRVDSEGNILGFHLGTPKGPAELDLAFTGIQIVDPSVITLIPENAPYSSIDLYRRLISEGRPVKGFIAENIYWIDIGSPAKYARASMDQTVPALYRSVFGKSPRLPLSVTHLSGDGSDRTFSRIEHEGSSMIMCDHGITMNAGVSEALSFENIGRHLWDKGLPVPRIYHADRFSGQVYLEDLGDIHLETAVKQISRHETVSLYKKVLTALAHLSVTGAEGFRDDFTYQTTHYDKTLIIERECDYFINAFVRGVLGMDVDSRELSDEFSLLADHALNYGYDGFMHRDFQSRNIMIKGTSCYFIDFQGGRTGPVQYDLASLLIDPYTGLDTELQDELLHFFMDYYKQLRPVNTEEFLYSYKYLRITRNLQMLGAFGFLSRVKGKKQFEDHIPLAVKNLKRHMDLIDPTPFRRLKKIIDII